VRLRSLSFCPSPLQDWSHITHYKSHKEATVTTVALREPREIALTTIDPSRTVGTYHPARFRVGRGLLYQGTAQDDNGSESRRQ